MIRSTFYGFTTALSGLKASQTSLDVIGQNISNTNTDGYTRQRALQNSRAVSITKEKYGSNNGPLTGQGTKINKIGQIRDNTLDTRYRVENSSVGRYSAELNSMKDMESIFDEAIKSGMRKSIGNFEKAFQNLSLNTGSNEHDALTRASAESMTKLFNQYSRQLSDAYNADLYDFKNGYVADANDLLRNLAAINGSILSAEVSGGNPLELYDKRNTMLDKLSSYFDMNYYYEEKTLASNIRTSILHVQIKDKAGGYIDAVSGQKFAQFGVDAGVKARVASVKDSMGKPILDGGGNPITNPVLQKDSEGNNLEKTLLTFNMVDDKNNPVRATFDGNPNSKDYIYAVENGFDAKTGKKSYIYGRIEKGADGKFSFKEEPAYTPPADKEIQYLTYDSGSIMDNTVSLKVSALTENPTATYESIEAEMFSNDKSFPIDLTPVYGTDAAGIPLEKKTAVTNGIFFGALNMLNAAGDYEKGGSTVRGYKYYVGALDTLANTMAKDMNNQNRVVKYTAKFNDIEAGQVLYNVVNKTGTGVNTKYEDVTVNAGEQLYAIKDGVDGAGKPKYKLGTISLAADGKSYNFTPYTGGGAAATYVYEETDRFDESNALFTTTDGVSTEGITAANMSLSHAWLQGHTKIVNSNKYVASNDDNSGDNSNTLKFIKLFKKNTKFMTKSDINIFTGGYENFLSAMGDTSALDVKTQSTTQNSYNVVLQSIDNDRMSVSGVSIDEEAVDIYRFQRAYEASSRVMTTMDEMLDKLINSTGVVGR